MRGRDYIHFLHYKCHKINFKWGVSYIDSLGWIKNKKAAISYINRKYNKCFQYAVTVTLSHEEIRKYQQIITKIKPFTEKYNWEGINHPSGKDIWKKIEKKNLTIALNISYAKRERIYPVQVSKHDSNCEKQVILLMTPNGERWHYLEVKKNISNIDRNIFKT